MSYLRKTEYEMIPQESFLVIHNCSGCGGKSRFKNTKKFRVNANGSKLDVWLIYQCEKCRHTLNLAIYERQKVSLVPKNEYKGFLSNEEQLAEMYGKNMQLFRKNKAEIDFEALQYRFVKRLDTTGEHDGGPQTVITIHNPYGLKIRPEKQIAEILGLSRSRMKKQMEQGEIRLEKISPYLVTACVNDLQE